MNPPKATIRMISDSTQVAGNCAAGWESSG